MESSGSDEVAGKGDLTTPPDLDLEMVLLPKGVFWMGSPANSGDSDEHPRHRIEISRPFYLQTTPVNQYQWQCVMGYNFSHYRSKDRLPVEMVSWNDAQKFIGSLNEIEKTNKYRLPTEAEWEYACKAGREDQWYCGNEHDKLPKFAWFAKNSRGRTHVVGQKKANRFGLYDMHGNVWEWCQDWYDKDYYTKRIGQGPEGPPRGKKKVCRGGAWYCNHNLVRSANRGKADPANKENHIGFRLAKDC